MTDYFSDSYAVARQRFLAAAREAGAELTTYRNPAARGPEGEELCTDVAWLGPQAARQALVAVSGTHGVEGYCGSAGQLALLHDGLPSALPPGTGVLLVHALNPYGFAHNRRVNEDNVDVNRNFVDHDDPPVNRDYRGVHGALVPAAWDGEPRAAADAQLMEVVAAQGARHLQAVVTRGQWTHPDGLFYGGQAPVWSHRTLRAIAETFLPGRDRIAYIDLHTGLGERGIGEPIFRGGRDDGAFPRARSWYGPSLSRSEDGTASSTVIVGNTATLIADTLAPQQQLTAITLEFGTVSGFEVLQSLRADNWLSLQERVSDHVRKEIKDQIRAAFCPPETDWRAAVLPRAEQVFRQALAGLAE